MDKITVNLAASPGEDVLESLITSIGYLDGSIRSIELLDGEIHITIDRDAQTYDRQSLLEDIEDVINRTLGSFSKVSDQTLFECSGSPVYNMDPMQEILKERQAIEVSPGIYVYQGDLNTIITNLNRFMREYALSFGATEQYYPVTVPLNSMIENGYISGFPHHALFVASLRPDMQNLKSAADNISSHVSGSDIFSDCKQMLAPTVCYHCFEALRDQVVKEQEYIFTAVNHCHRNEGKSINGLARLNTFSMREIIIFSDAGKVVDKLEKIREDTKEIFNEWNLAFKINTATDPFFPVNVERKRAYQSLQQLKLELRIKLPFNDSSIACCSFNNHKDTLVKSYSISCANGNLASGCVGYGLERLAYGLFAQFGLKLKQWPAQLRKDLDL